MSRKIEVVIKADSRRLQLGLCRAELRLTDGWRRRLSLRFRIWRLERSLR